MLRMLTIYRYDLNGFLNVISASYALAVPVNIMHSKFFRPLIFIFFVSASPQLAANAAEEIEPGTLPAVDCVINPYRVVDVSSPVAGVIEGLFVDRSQQVSAGQVIARMEASVERANVDLARYRASVESDVELGMVNINFDRLRKKRIDSLLEKSNVSREIADQVERELKQSEWKLKQARELEKIRKLELRKAQAQLGQKSISSPFDGFVLDIFKHPGEYVEDQAIARLAQLDPLVIEAIVPMENFGQIHPGMQADVVPDILLKNTLRGEVIAVDRIGDTASNTFGVKLSMPNPENRIPAGLKCIAKFIETTPEQIAAQANFAASEEPPAPQLAESGLSETEDNELQGLLSSVIGNANAATTPAKTVVDSDYSMNKDMKQSINRKQIQSGEVVTESLNKTPTSYMVIIKKPETRAATEDLVDQLRAAGEDDFFVYKKTDRISLGVFQTRAAAEKRRREIASLGFMAHTLERYK